MRKTLHSRLALLFSILFLGALSFLILGKKKNAPSFIREDDEKEEITRASDNPIARAKYEFDMLKDPKTGQIPEGVRFAELAEAEIMPLKEGNAFGPAL
ncbi:MAG TPA: hypothetical protein VJT83_08570, partial [Chitinophagaceae bacterium]|nr:hypothetical protein [Chitinophagaceae bacterium]